MGFEVIDHAVDLVLDLLSFLTGFAPGVGFSHVVVPGVELDLSEYPSELEQFPICCVVTLEQHLTAGAVQVDGWECCHE